MNDQIKILERRVAELEASVLQLIDLQNQSSHWMTLMARQVRQMAHEMDMDVEPPRMN